MSENTGAPPPTLCGIQREADKKKNVYNMFLITSMESRGSRPRQLQLVYSYK